MYGGVPPLNEVERVVDWPESIEDDPIEGASTTSGGSTLTKSVRDIAFASGVPTDESVTV